MVFGFLAADQRARLARVWILLALLILGVAPSASAINTTGLVAHYAFDGNANDDSGNANNGTVVGGAAFTSGKTGSALAITNGTQYVSGPNVTVGTSFSFAGWYKIDSAQTVQGTIGQWYSFFNTSQYCGTTLLGMMYNRPSGYIRIYPAGNGCSGVHDIPVTLPLDAWFHFATTYDGSLIRTYVNGVLVDQFAYSTNITGSQQLIVGASVPNVAYNWIGAIDDVYVFNRSLSSAEITSLAGAQPVQVRVLNDTGQTLCYDASNAAVACSASVGGDGGINPRQDARNGRDAQATSGQLTKVGGGAAAFDFTKVCMNGEDAGVGSCPAAPTSNSGANPAPADWGCTRDNLTGLVWSLQAFVSMSWEGANSTATSATNRCNFSTAWRLPSATELEGIVDYGRATSPSVDVNYFPGTANASYWAATLDANLAGGAWNVRFSDGGADRQLKSNLYSVRLVRSSQ